VAAVTRTGGARRVTIAGEAPQTIDPAEQVVDRDDQGVVVGVVRGPDRDGRRSVEVVVDGWRFEVIVEDAARADVRDRATRDRAGGLTGGGPLEIRAIIPGRVVEVRVTADDAVEAGQALLVVEAMKMQNELRAPRAGTVQRVAAAVGTTVEVGDLLVILG
jgi:biotin carboxyl carrier protein